VITVGGNHAPELASRMIICADEIVNDIVVCAVQAND